MTDNNMKVLINIIGAVESGGQVYGKRRYDAYAAPYTNTSKEHTITLGGAQYSGGEAKELIKRITDKLGTPSSLKSVMAKDWVSTRFNPTSKQKQDIISLIDSEVGHAIQDEMFAELMQKFIADCEKEYTKDTKAIMMYCEIRHLGGKSAVDRIFKKCYNYNIDTIMSVLKQDQNDTSSSNQVGDKKFWDRHEKCKEFIEKYVEVDNMNEIDKLLGVAENEIGYLEKKSNKDLDSKTGNAGSNNYTKYGRDLRKWYSDCGDTYGVDYQWCDQFVDWCFTVAFGRERAMQLLGGPSAYTPTSAGYFKKMGRYDRKPKKGDVVFFRNSERICHTGIVYRVDGSTVYTIEGNTSGASTLVSNGGGVKKKSYNVTSSYIDGFGHPAYKAEDKKKEKKEEHTTDIPNGIHEEPFVHGVCNVDLLNVRRWAGTKYENIKKYPHLAMGNEVDVCSYVLDDEGKMWYYVRIAGSIYGFVSAKYITIDKIDNREKFLKECKKVCDEARKGKYKYGDSHAIPPTTDKVISCDRMVAKALWNMGYTDQPRGGITCGNADGYLKKWGLKRSTKLSDAKRGSIMLVTHKGETGVTHMFVFASDFVDGKGDRYDCGSQENINKVQPIKGVGFWYRTDKVIVYNWV